MLTEAYAGGVMRGLVRLAGLGLLAACLLIPLGSTAFAHAAYKDSNPADEAEVPQAPSEIWAEYTEPPSEGSYLRVFDPCGEQVDHGDSRPEGYRVYITLSAARAGTYRVEWFVDSSLDNHPTRGTFTFTATNGDPCPGAEPIEKERETGREPRANDRQDEDRTQLPADDDGDGGSAAGGGGGKADERHRQHARGGDRAGAGKSRDDSKDGRVVAAEFPRTEDVVEEPGLLSDIPLGGVVVGLVMTILIGAAGGFIYAGIMGYHRVSN